MNQTYKHILILLVVSAITFGFKVGERDFWGRHGEARRAEVSREMVVSGNWMVLHLNGQPFVTKPPLYYWVALLKMVKIRIMNLLRHVLYILFD